MPAKKKKNVFVKKRFFVAMLCIAILVFSSTFYIRHNVRNYCTEYAEALVGTKVSDCLYLSASQTLCSNPKYQGYSQFVDVCKDINNNVSFVQINMLLVNLLMVDLTNACQNNMNTLCADYKVKMPFGVLFGSVLFADNGLCLDMDIVPIGNIYCAFESSFKNAGINQTKHCLYFNIEAKVELVLPLYVKAQNISIKVLVYEHIIVGKVPDVYMDGVDSDGIDLLPS
ncbi:MAG: sporulation protein YunB [Clostridia bacterium]